MKTGSMWQLFQFPLCPFSRKVRLLLGEKGVSYELAEVIPWQAGDDFFQLNPAGRTPVLHNPQKNLTLMDSRAICEYFEETEDRAPMILGTATNRAEIRRLVALFDESFFADVTAPLLNERLRKPAFEKRSPDSGAVRAAMKMANGHLDYIDYLIDTRPWLAGAQMSMADLAAAAQISVVDYLGGIDWAGHEQTRGWYSVFKSRPSFRPMLSERMGTLRPPAHYSDVNA